MSETIVMKVRKLLCNLRDNDDKAAAQKTLIEIYNSMYGILYSKGLCYFNNAADIKDAIQEMFHKLPFQMDKFRTETHPIGWLIKIFQNACKNKLKAKRRSIPFSAMEDMGYRSWDICDDTQMIEDKALVDMMLDSLNPRERLVLELHYWGKCSINDIAEILHKPKSTVASQLDRIKEKLRKKFSRD